MFCAQVFAKSSAGVSFCPWKAGHSASKAIICTRCLFADRKGTANVQRIPGVAKRFQAAIMRCNRCSLLGLEGIEKEENSFRKVSSRVLKLHTALLQSAVGGGAIQSFDERMILKFGQHLLWQESRPFGCANARFNSQCTRQPVPVIVAFTIGSARLRQRLSPKISLNLKVSRKPCRRCRNNSPFRP